MNSKTGYLITQLEEQKEKEREESLLESCDTIKWINIYITGIPGEARKGQKAYLKK